jgi:hypothetical protein
VRIGGGPSVLNRANGGPPRVGANPWGGQGISADAASAMTRGLS